MDPDVILTNARNAVKDLTAELYGVAGDRERAIDAAEFLAEAFENLDTWLSKGGFLPAAWNHSKRHSVTNSVVRGSIIQVSGHTGDLTIG